MPANQEPHDPLTRGEIAEMAYRTAKVQEKGFIKAYTYEGKGEASYYHPSLAGNLTANGEIYDPQAMTAAHRTLPFGTNVKVTRNGKSIVVRINDRGPYHDGRIIDLSEKAFYSLGKQSEGVYDVYVEVQSNDNVSVAVPETVLFNLQEQTKEGIVPDVVASAIDLEEKKNLERGDTPFDFEKAEQNQVPSVTGDFFQTWTLRSPLDTEVWEGTYTEIYGIAKDYGNREVTGVLFNPKTKENQQFEGELSGKNFVIPVHFTKAGDYTFGVIFGDGGTTRVTEMKVLPHTEPIRPPSAHTFQSDFDFSLDPQTKVAKLSHTPQAEDTVIKYKLEQVGGKSKTLYADAGISEFLLPFDYFLDFDSPQPITISLHMAKSYDTTQRQRFSHWRRTKKREYKLAQTLLPVKKTSILQFEKYLPLNTSQEIKIATQGQDLSVAHVIAPNGNVAIYDLKIEEGEAAFTLFVDLPGAYVVQVSKMSGETVFQDVVYARPDKNWVLPVQNWDFAAIPQAQSADGVLWWTNQIRKSQSRTELEYNQSLANLAQQYATQMASQGFFSHTGPDGQTLQDRIQSFGPGSYGENLGMGTSFEKVLETLEVSGSHRKNMLNPEWREMGVGMAYDSQDRVFLVVLFHD